MTTKTATGTDLLRLALRIDGVATPASGVALMVIAGLVDSDLGIPFGFLIGLGVFYVLFGGAVFAVSSQPVINRRAAGAVVVVNLVYALDSVIMVAAGMFDLTTLGAIAVLAVAAGVAGIAGLQWYALRRA
ncbi:hypothetical protein EV193_104271 [Herbihabitans rhizosphaerae]|uniref:Integral membrane protein n=1 Tax=Herbihabitans rhizosphaerae TaxID=1872711 RepID=A0A4Q7KSG5_9PSEU|nr:hypothetical protein [Herbihabitans rhizosphaerae]RZS39060.1 hypothetical protein EV193_104271 [Herbihabitans rhizosphaerae]